MIPNEGRGSLTPTKQNKEQGRKKAVRREKKQDWKAEGGLEEWEGSWWVGMGKVEKQIQQGMKKGSVDVVQID